MTDAMTRALRVIQVWADNDALDNVHVARLCKKALESQPAPGARVPEWKLLPAEPTEAMLSAIVDAGRFEDEYIGVAEDMYNAMFSVAPQPPEQEPEQ